MRTLRVLLLGFGIACLVTGLYLAGFAVTVLSVILHHYDLEEPQ